MNAKFKPNDTLSRCENALEQISTGLSMLELCALEGLSGSRYIDVAARLNAQANAIEKLVKPMKDQIKTKALEDNPGSNSGQFVVKGVKYQATVTKIAKIVLDYERVKTFFGKKLAQYMTTRNEIQVSFTVKE